MEEEVAADNLMSQSGSGRHKELSINQLVPFAPLALGHGVKIGDSQRSW
jgi:hypothetical protein